MSVILGAQWGDEGKGKLVNLLTSDEKHPDEKHPDEKHPDEKHPDEKHPDESKSSICCVRFNGGANAGHTIINNGKKYVFHLLPCGIINKKCICIIGHGCVVHIPTLFNELENNQNITTNNLYISEKAHVVLNLHQEIDAKKYSALGTTKRGIGPTYAEKMNRSGIRMEDFRDWKELELKVKRIYAIHGEDPMEELKILFGYKTKILSLISDTITLLHEQTNIIFEGANAAMLDIDCGTYPYVTSSNTTIGAVLTGSGANLSMIKEVYGVIKAYTTRVGEGPFPTECDGEILEYLRDKGKEIGTTTGRNRRCGWLDLPMIKYTHKINGYTCLFLSKLDVLSGLDEIKVGIEYKKEVEYKVFKGWKQNISNCRQFNDLPEEAKEYVNFIEKKLNIPIKWIGVGPENDQNICK